MECRGRLFYGTGLKHALYNFDKIYAIKVMYNSCQFVTQKLPRTSWVEVCIMFKHFAIVFLFSFLAGSTALAQAQGAQAPSSTEPEATIRATSREVVLDVVVRDKHHHPVNDLRPNEVTILEDGVQQKINDFRDVGGSEQLQTELTMAKSAPTASQSSAPSPVNNQLKQLNFVSIVFAQIAPLNLEFAREAVQEFLKSDVLPNTYVTIYSLDRNLRMVQSYTSDKTLLTRAVNTVTKGLHGQDQNVDASGASGINATLRASVDNLIANPATTPALAQALQNELLNPLPTIAQDPLWARNAASEDASVDLNNALLAQAKLATGIRFAEGLVNGMDAFDGMRLLIRSQEKLPGRKIVLYLADGLTLPPGRRDVVNGLVSLANRTGVVFYTVDTRGLSVQSPTSAGLSNMAQTGAESSANRTDPAAGHLEGDDIDLAVSSNTQLSMQEIAESTGGFAVANTNQIAEPMQRVMEDIRDHYEIAYAPTSTKYDGHFRTIEVRISRPHVTVQTRKGYFALPDINGEPLEPYEMAGLTAIGERPSPTAFPYEAAFMKFRPGPDTVSYEMTFDIPISALSVLVNRKTSKVQARASLLALIHNANGDIVGKISRNLMREADKSDLPQFAKQRILYAEPLALASGHYHVDLAVTDPQTQKTSVKHLSLVVDSGKEFGLSSLELVKSVTPQSGPRLPQDPFETDTVRVVPTLAQSVPGGQPFDVYFVVYPQKEESTEGPKLTMQMFQDGKETARQTLAMPSPQKDGSVPFILRLNPPPGECDLVVTAQDGALAAQSTLSVKVDPPVSPTTN